MSRLEFVNMEKDENDCYYYVVYNKKSEVLGHICFDMEWSTYVWEQSQDMKMAKGCLKEVLDFMYNL